jgi:hypothetical protein
MIYQKQGCRLRGMIDRSHQLISEVALSYKLKAVGYWTAEQKNLFSPESLASSKSGKSAKKEIISQ